MALEARLIDIRPEDDNTFSFAAEYYDTADPALVLFTSPRWARATDTPPEEIDALICQYGCDRDAAEEAPLSVKDRTVEVIADYSPSPERVEAAREAKAAAELAAREAEAAAAAEAEAAAAPEG